MNKKMLEFKNVSRSFVQGKETIYALRETNFSINAGEFVAIIGPSGSGKSTFLTIAGGLRTPTAGNVIIDGTDISNLSKKELSDIRLKYLGFIFQASNLVPFLTVEKQLRLIDVVKKVKTDDAVIDKLLTELGIETLKNKYPGDLSGGQRQRAAIARVIYSQPSLVLADEPTASLDTTKAFEVVKLLALETKQRKNATIMVTHDERLIQFCDKVYEMNDGVLKLRSSKK